MTKQPSDTVHARNTPRKGVVVSFVSEWPWKAKRGKGISAASFLILSINKPMKHTIIAALLCLPLSSFAKTDSTTKYINHHRFEVAISGGYGLDAKIKYTGNNSSLKPPLAYGTAFENVSLVYYITPRINAGIGFANTTWETSVYGHRNKDGNAYGYVTANYNLPVRSSIFYGGISAGSTFQYEFTGEGSTLGNDKSLMVNAHIGYKLTMVKNRLWFTVEAQRMAVKVPSPYSRVIDVKEWLYAYPILGGLNFKI